jgi:hypothetical protein
MRFAERHLKAKKRCFAKNSLIFLPQLSRATGFDLTVAQSPGGV